MSYRIRLPEQVYQIIEDIRKKFPYLTDGDIFIILAGNNPDKRIDEFIGMDAKDFLNMKSRAIRERLKLYVRRAITIKNDDKINIVRNLRKFTMVGTSKKDIIKFIDISIELNVDADDNKFRNFLTNLRKELENKSNRDCHLCLLECLSQYEDNFKAISTDKK